MLIVAWAWPDELKLVMPSGWAWIYQNRFVAPLLVVKCPVRNAHCDEDLNKRKRDRETGITYVSLEGLTDSERDFCMRRTATCEFSTSSEWSRASFLWLAGARLPESCRGRNGPLEYPINEARTVLERGFFAGGYIALTALLQHCGQENKKKNGVCIEPLRRWQLSRGRSALPILM